MMGKIAILTDTDSSLPLDVAARHDIAQVPITVQFGEQAFQAVYGIDDARAFERIDREGKLPTTAAPAPGQFAEAYQKAFEGGAEQVVCLCVSSLISATYQSACTACDEFPGRDITVIDSQSLSMGQGFMALEAAKAAAQGASKDEVIARAIHVRQRSRLYAALSTLKYLAMSGRVGHLAAGIATLLNVRPILTIRNGKLDLLERVRTRQKAWGRVIELADEETQGKKIEQLAFLHVNALEDAKIFEKQFRAILPAPADSMFVELTPGLSIHSGAGLVGVSYVIGE
jgi:DegV family protein with EDD domain